MYTQHATGLIRENTNNNPQGMSSLFGNVSGGGVAVVGGQHYVLTKKGIRSNEKIFNPKNLVQGFDGSTLWFMLLKNDLQRLDMTSTSRR